MRADTVRIDVHVTPGDLERALRHDAVAGLTADPKELKPKWFYDDRGSELFDQITRLGEYYLTRREREILTARAPEIARITRADTLVELGSGTSEKTRLLLDAMSEAEMLTRYVPFDVSEGVLRESARAIDDSYPGVDVHAVAGDFERHLHELPRGGRRLVAFLGSTIGNFPPRSRAPFLADVARSLDAGDAVVLGFDLVKDVDRLEAAYNDARGVTADFNRNVLRVLNRALRGDFDVGAFEHVARWDPDEEWIEMLLVSDRDQHVRLEALEIDVSFAAGETMRTEISAKFRPERVEAELAAAGLRLRSWWTDAADDFGLALASPA